MGLPGLGQGGGLCRGVDQPVVYLVGDDEDVFFARPGCDGFKLDLGVAAARGVGGRVEDEHPGLVRARRLQGVQGDKEVLVRCGGHEYGYTVRQLDHGRVADPVGGRDEHLVTLIEQGHEQVVEHLLAAVADDGVVARGSGSVETAIIGGHALAQLGNARHRGVAGEALVQGRLGRLADMPGRAEIGLAHGQTDDLPALRLQRLRLGVHGQGGRRLDPLQTVGNTHATLA